MTYQNGEIHTKITLDFVCAPCLAKRDSHASLAHLPEDILHELLKHLYDLSSFRRLSMTCRAIYEPLRHHYPLFDKALGMFASLAAQFTTSLPAAASSETILADVEKQLALTRDALMFCRAAATWGRARNMNPTDALLFAPNTEEALSRFNDAAPALTPPPPSSKCVSRDFQSLSMDYDMPAITETWIATESLDARLIFVRRTERRAKVVHTYICVDRFRGCAYECFQMEYRRKSNRMAGCHWEANSKEEMDSDCLPSADDLPELLGFTTESEVLDVFKTAFPGFPRDRFLEARDPFAPCRTWFGHPVHTRVLRPEECEALAIALPSTVPPALREFGDLIGPPHRFVASFVPRWIHRAALRHVERLLLRAEAQGKLSLLPIAFTSATGKDLESELPQAWGWAFEKVTYTVARRTIIDLSIYAAHMESVWEKRLSKYGWASQTSFTIKAKELTSLFSPRLGTHLSLKASRLACSAGRFPSPSL
ncbi:hypothetical protein BDZ88DRAFT_302814 [Geranomyces variabilis]|nr:hypothetical protein BDZ88DRAFT_302814 [Geranomyces variabilis]